jgi:hypothetical protein
MNLTNNSGLPLPIVKAVENDPYDNFGTLSVTTLLKPPQAHAILNGPHKGELTEDVSDRIWALIGQVGHSILERAAGGLDPKVWIAERRYFAELAGRKLSGQADLIHMGGGVVYDFKFTSGWAVIDARTGKSDWRIQLSMLAWLARRGVYTIPELKTTVEEPIDIKQGKIVAIVRDWTKSTAARVRDWPEKKVEVIDMNIMSDEETEAWMIARIAEFDAAERGETRPCTDEERWHSPGKWAVFKNGNQKASKLEDTELELSAWIGMNRAKLGSNYRIEQRPGADKRCAEYCAAAAFCPQYQANKAAMDQGEE